MSEINRGQLNILEYGLRFSIIFIGYLLLALIIFAIPYFAWQFIFKTDLPEPKIVDYLILLGVAFLSILTTRGNYELKYLLRKPSTVSAQKVKKDPVKNTSRKSRLLFSFFGALGISYLLFVVAAFASFSIYGSESGSLNRALDNVQLIVGIFSIAVISFFFISKKINKLKLVANWMMILWVLGIFLVIFLYGV